MLPTSTDILFISLDRNNNIDTTLDQWESAFLENPIISLQILLNLRDTKGRGEKRLSLIILVWLRFYDIDLYLYVLSKFVYTSIGCWKDIIILMNSLLLNNINARAELIFITDQLEMDINNNIGNISLLSKWLPSEGKSYPLVRLTIRDYMRWDNKTYRLIVNNLRRIIRIPNKTFIQLPNPQEGISLDDLLNKYKISYTYFINREVDREQVRQICENIY